MQSHRLISIIAWAVLTFIAFATLSPYSLRPELSATEPGIIVLIEHVGAFGLLGLLFLLGYPERPRTVCVVVFGSAIALELAQAFLPDRHAQFVDALEKVVGGGSGIILGVALLPVLTSSHGLLSRVNRRWLKAPLKVVDSEVRELAIGSCALMVFAVALVTFQNLAR
jgi:VanZ family protein